MSVVRTPDNSRPDEVRRRVIAAIGCVSLAAGVWAARFIHPIPLSHEPSQAGDRVSIVRTGVNPNTASWPEIAQLPGIGENLARRIVEFRDRAPSKRNMSPHPFQNPADLTAVKGLGRATIARIRPYLRFDARPSSVDR